VDTLGFALVGLDHWYNAFPMADAIAAVSDAELRWVVDDDERRARMVAEKYDAAFHGTEYDPVLSDPSVHVIVFFVSSDKSARMTVAAAEAGKHIISIKPMAMSLEEADRVVEAVHRTGAKFFPGSASHLFYVSYQTFKEWIDAGRIGKLVAASSSFHASLPRDWMDSSSPGWFADPTRVPGGAWIDHAVFYLQLFRKWFDTEIIRVESTTANLKYADLAVEDYGQGAFTFSDGRIATITATWLGAPRANRHSLELFGSDGTLVWDSLLNKVAVTGAFSDELLGWIQIDRQSEPFSRTASMIEHLIKCVREDRTPLATVDDDRAALAAALAFYEAAQSHHAVEL
jgi:predicted dehydrogenase